MLIMKCLTMANLDTNLRSLTSFFKKIIREYFWFILLALILIFFFIVNFGYGRFYAFTDISNIELHPWQELLKRFSMWQQCRGFGVELGTEAGYAIPLAFFSFLSAIGFGALQINFINNLLLFVLPGLSVSVLAYSIFYRDSRRKLVAFFAGLLFATSFLMYIRILSPLFLQVWPWIMSSLIAASVILILQTGKKRFWLMFLVLCYLNLGAFIGLPSALAPMAFGGLYVLYYLLVESRNKRQDSIKVLIAALVFFLVSLPMIWSVIHVVFSDAFQIAGLAKTYTMSVFTLNLQNRDFSSLLYGFRLIGTGNWNLAIQMPGFVGRLGYPYYTLFTYNAAFVFSSFMLPIVAFGALLFKESKLLSRRLLFLGLVSVLFFFLMKGVREPFGSLFLWLMTHVSQFAIFRTPYDKIAPALAYSLSIMGAYTFSRILPSMKEISQFKSSIGKFSLPNSFSTFLLSVKKKSVFKKAVAVVLLTALVIDAYPAYSGQLLVPLGFFNIPPYYQQLADYVKANPASYKILGLPSVEYTNRYSWGYFGITFDGVNLDKPVLERSYMGSDLYGDRVIGAIQDDVLFRSDISSAPVVGGTLLYADNTSPNATINLEGVKYFNYLLQKANDGQIMLRNDAAGGYAYQLNSLDWQRYDDLFSSLNSLGFIGNPKTFGNVTIYDVNNYLPLVYANSPANVYTTNDYSTFLGDAYVSSRLSVLASLSNYNTSYDYVSGSTNTGSAEIYVPIIANQYYTEIQNNLNIETQYTVTPNAALISQLNNTLLELGKIVSDYNSIYYVDNIQNPGTFDILLKLDNVASTANETANAYSGKQLAFGNQTVVISELGSLGNGWFKIGSVNLDAGELVIRSDIPSQVTLTLPDGVTEDKLPANIIVQNKPVHRLNNGTWIVELGFGAYTYGSLEQLLTSNGLDANFRQNIAKALNVKIATTDLDVALVSSDILQNNSPAPPIVFRQIQPGQLLINVENASSSFFLNFLESYQAGWKLYGVPTKMLTNAEPARDYAGSVELKQASNPFPDSNDLTALGATSVLDDSHFLLNGFANSWYVNLTELSNRHIITQKNDGTYDFSLLLYFEPQANFVLGLAISVIAGLTVCVVLGYSTIRIWTRSKKLKHKYST